MKWLQSTIQHSKKKIKNQQVEKSVKEHGHLVSPTRDEKQPNETPAVFEQIKHMYVAGTYITDAQ